MNENKPDEIDEAQKWYNDFCASYRNATCKKCGNKGHKSVGACDEGCCDKWKCTKCGNTFLVELG